MKITELENIIIEKLNKGLLDGPVGPDFNTGGHAIVTIRKFIVDGIPQIIRFGADRKYFDNKETIKIAGQKTVQLFESVADKLQFFQKYGFLLNDSDVKAYSALFKPKN